MRIHKTIVEIVRGSVLDQDVDAIVNAANTALRGGGGVDGAIHRSAGLELMEELKRAAPGGTKTGTVVMTSGHHLKQKHILHTPGPIWNGGHNGEAELLQSCYRSCMDMADDIPVASLAFCSISTGVYGYPLEQAAPLALQTVFQWLNDHPQTNLARVVFSLYHEREYGVFEQALRSLSQTS